MVIHSTDSRGHGTDPFFHLAVQEQFRSPRETYYAMGEHRTRPRVLLLCSPCLGHLIPFTELARRLVADHGLAATLLFAAVASPPSEQYLALAASVPDGVDLVALPAPPEGDDASAHPRDRVTRAVRGSVPRVREVARALAPRPAALVVDMAGGPARGVAAELGVPCYMFFTSPWMTLSLFLHLPALDAMPRPLRLPGCCGVPVHEQDLPLFVRVHAARGGDTYAAVLSMANDVTGFDGILVNTFGDLEPGADVTTVDGLRLPPVHLVGPLVWTRPPVNREDHECLRWLDQQPRGSVVYVSFGSGGTLTSQQTTELALGLELSRCRFLWAVKRPDQSSTSAAFFGSSRSSNQQGALDFLPDGFVERTREVGFVTASAWAPQTAILERASVGCFVTHCGWNSVLESVRNGVPMVAWPLYAEQNMNAAMLEVQVKVAVRVRQVGADRFVSKEEVRTAIRRVMMQGDEAKRLRERAGEVRERSLHALGENGGSAQALAQIASEWK